MEQNISVNEVVQAGQEKQLYRVLWVSSDQEYGYWISLERQTCIPEKFMCREMIENISAGEVVVVEDPIRVYEGNVAESAKERRDEWWRILKPILECEPDIYERRRRGELLSETAKKSNKDKANLYR